MSNGNRIFWLLLFLIVAGASWLGVRLLRDSSTGRHVGPLDIGSSKGVESVGDAAGGSEPGVAETVSAARTVGAPVEIRAGGSAERTTAVAAFSEGAEERPLRGTVRDPEGEPVVGARLSVRLKQAAFSGGDIAGAEVASAVSDASGGFSLEGFVRLGERYVLDATHGSFARTRVAPIDPLVPATMTRDVVLSEGLRIEGRVRGGEAGAPLSGVEVVVHDLELHAMDPRGVEEQRVVTDGAGAYEVRQLSSGRKRVVVRTPGFASEQRSPIRLATSMRGLDFDLTEGNHIVGRVVDAETGAGLEGVVISAAVVGEAEAPSRIHVSAAEGAPRSQRSGEVVRTGVDGSFRIEGLARGLHLVSVVDGPGRGASVNAASGDEGVEIKVRLRGVVAGRVVDADTGLPVGRFSVALVRGERSASVPGSVFRRCSEQAGAFELLDVEPGRHHVVVTAPGYAPGSSRPLETALGERLGGVEIRLKRGLVVHGRVVDDRGRPIEGARVVVIEEVELPASKLQPGLLPRRRVDAMRATASTFADGSFLAPNLARGRFHLRVEHPDYAWMGTRSFELFGSEELLELSEIVLEPGAVVHGVVRDASGAADYQAIVTALPQGVRGKALPVRPSATDGQGRYELRGLAPGTWRIVVSQRAGRVQLDQASHNDSRRVQLSPGDRRRVDFRER